MLSALALLQGIDALFVVDKRGAPTTNSPVFSEQKFGSLASPTVEGNDKIVEDWVLLGVVVLLPFCG